MRLPISVHYTDTHNRTSLDRPEGTPFQTSEDGEEGEAMDAIGDDDAAMMAMMGLSGFGSTKVRCIVWSFAIR